MILLEVILAGLLLSLATGGSLRNLVHEQLKAEWVLLLLLPTQLAWPAISERLGLDCALSIIVWLLMMAGLAVTLMLNARRQWMLAFAALGIAMNILVIGANQAMPVSIKAASEIGATRPVFRDALDTDCLHEEMTDSTVLTALADVVAVPGPEWQRGVLSVGDMLLALGLAGWMYSAAKCRRSV
ncbi:MAG: hypothetical protein EG823_08950 [Actinobacteria bacterium]|nr:hypothetical protein [Actinomycetota bacterium]